MLAIIGFLYLISQKWEARKIANMFLTGHPYLPRQSASDQIHFLETLKPYIVKVIDVNNNSNGHIGFLKAPVKGGNHLIFANYKKAYGRGQLVA
jgi:hypothetical protein